MRFRSDSSGIHDTRGCKEVVKFSLSPFQDTCASCSYIAPLACSYMAPLACPVCKSDISQSAHERHISPECYEVSGCILYRLCSHQYANVWTERGSHLFWPVASAQTTVIGLHFPDITIVVTAIREAFVIIITEVPNSAQRYSVQMNTLADRQ